METLTRGVNGHYGSAFLPCSGEHTTFVSTLFDNCANQYSAEMCVLRTIQNMWNRLREWLLSRVTP